MAKTIELTVPEPCHENWDGMTPTEKGRFCAACQKDVVDFTNMGQAELVAFFRKKSSGNVCGRFYNDQLNNPMPLPVKRIPWARYFFQITLPAFIVSGKLMAQGKVIPEYKKNETEVLLVTGGVLREKKQSPVQATSVKGQVTDETGNGIPYASIINNKTRGGIAADSLGHFILKDVHLLEGSEYTISAVGYTSKTIFASRIDQHKSLQIQLVADNTLDEVVITTYATTRCSWSSSGVVIVNLKSLTDEIKPLPVQSLATIGKEKVSSEKKLTVSPNPVAINNSFNIQVNIESPGKYQYDILSADGRLVRSGTQNFVVGLNNFNLLIDNRFTAGTYIVQIQDKKGKEKLNTKFIVQH